MCQLQPIRSQFPSGYVKSGWALCHIFVIIFRNFLLTRASYIRDSSFGLPPSTYVINLIQAYIV